LIYVLSILRRKNMSIRFFILFLIVIILSSASISCSSGKGQDSIYGSYDYDQTETPDKNNGYVAPDKNNGNDGDYKDDISVDDYNENNDYWNNNDNDNDESLVDDYYNTCGNEVLDPGEVCEIGNEEECEIINPDGYSGGTAICNEDCSGWITENCQKTDCWKNEDDPDENFIDSNCDGIDGNIEKSVFVDELNGNDENNGSMLDPVASVLKALNIAEEKGKKHILIAGGVYQETVELKSGISIHGAYSGYPSWKRGIENKVHFAGGTTGLTCLSSSNAELSFLFIYSSSTFEPGKSSVGVLFKNCSDITLSNVYIESGLGGEGNDSLKGNVGFNGERGGDGQSGCENDSFPCSGCSSPKAGKGGASTCGSNGGDGGTPGLGSNNGNAGTEGSGEFVSGGWGGNGGTEGYKDDKCAFIPDSITNGKNGTLGANGNHGDGGSALGSFEQETYVPADGSDGQSGYAGSGAGGGGGGKGGEGSAWCDSYGSSGGGGGAGGCGGHGGIGGKGGGGSFGMIISSCENINLENIKIKTFEGGKGGAGGKGGEGGNGGGRGKAGTHGGTAEQGDAGCGGYGGIGGKGGNGGAGGGGGGGPSIGIAYKNSTLFGVMETDYDIGKGGKGGESDGNNGENGKSTEIIEF
jgi:hypothetical protein